MTYCITLWRGTSKFTELVPNPFDLFIKNNFQNNTKSYVCYDEIAVDFYRQHICKLLLIHVYSLHLFNTSLQGNSRLLIQERNHQIHQNTKTSQQ